MKYSVLARVVAGVMCAGMLAAPLRAATIGISGATLIYGAESGDTLTVTGTISAGNLIVNDTTAAIFVVTPGCSVITANSVRCALAGFNMIDIIGGDNADSINFSTVALNMLVLGYGGGDTISTGSGDDTVYGGAGDDLITLNAGNETAFGGTGNDTIIGGSGVDTIDGSGPDAPDSPPTALPRLAVPEPATLALLGLGLAGIGFARRPARSH